MGSSRTRLLLLRALDSAARMNVLDGIRSLNRDVMEQIGKEYGADGVEISAHALCAEDHLPYQGKQYSREEFEEIQMDLDRPIGMWNCKHMTWPIVLGVSERTYSDEELQELNDLSTMEIEIDGKTRTRYQWTQEMRRAETAVRYQKDRAVLAAHSGNNEIRRDAQAKINALNDYYTRISEATDIPETRSRMYVNGFRAVKVKDTASGGTEKGTAGSTSTGPKASGNGAAEAVDWASAHRLANGDTRLTNMLRSGDVQQTADAVNEILNSEAYGFRASKWSGKALTGTKTEMGFVLGKKEWSCNIVIREDQVSNIKTQIHENLHSRSASWFTQKIYKQNKATEEASVEYMARQICAKAGVQFTGSYRQEVSALMDIMDPKNRTTIAKPKTIY